MIYLIKFLLFYFLISNLINASELLIAVIIESVTVIQSKPKDSVPINLWIISPVFVKVSKLST